MVGYWTDQPELMNITTSHLKVKASSENKSLPSSQVFLRVGLCTPPNLEPPSRRTRFLPRVFILPFLVVRTTGERQLPSFY